MRVLKSFERDPKTELVSRIFNEVITGPFHLPFEKIELHIRDRSISIVDGSSAIVCLDYNNPFILESDRRGIRILIIHELFRLMFKFDLPAEIEDILIGREMIKRGYGEELCYMYYSLLLSSRDLSAMKANLPWIIFFRDDNITSELLKGIAAKVCRKKLPQRLLDMLLDLNEKNIAQASKDLVKVQ
ncbi:MAG: hypothetical protein HY517_01330 [Candidatus Aenigmarchaeota archaeon]|nr:hypothetical protein [Candidatus Aenigmarchaeota archaeon]